MIEVSLRGVRVLVVGSKGERTAERLTREGAIVEIADRLSAGFPLVATDDPATAEAAAAQGLLVMPLDVPRSPGVTIVGGGPGDPGLLTVAGLAALRRAEVVVVDRLAPLDVLAELPREVLVIDASKQPGAPSMPQEAINELLVTHAKNGRQVVRLKGGDPFVFGRGMEEVQACQAAGVPVSWIPGVTSAIGVPGLAGVPVTHRGLTQAFTVVSGHVAPGHPDSQVDWASLARSGATIILLMAVRTLPAIGAALIKGGMPAATAVAVVMDSGARVERGTLGDVAGFDVKAPAVTVIGAVAGLL